MKWLSSFGRIKTDRRLFVKTRKPALIHCTKSVYVIDETKATFRRDLSIPYTAICEHWFLYLLFFNDSENMCCNLACLRLYNYA